MPSVIVYSKKDCPNCDKLKWLLNEENIEYNIVKIDTPEALTELRMNGVFTMSAPVLQIDNKFHVLNDMTSYDKNNKSSGMLVIDNDKITNIIEKEIRV